MSAGRWIRFKDFRNRLGSALVGPQTLAFLPALTLGAYWFGGEGLLLFCALLLPAAFAIAGLFSGTGPAWSQARDRDTDLLLPSVAEEFMDDTLARERASGMTTAAFAIEIDDFAGIESQYGSRAAGALMKQIARRISWALRDSDCVVRLDGPRFAVALSPVRRADLETAFELSRRLQAAIAEPISMNATRVFLTASVGFCLPARAPARTGAALLDGAQQALESALLNGAGSIRAYSKDTRKRRAETNALRGDLIGALESGQVQPWFQPQVATVDGAITGFEALARWNHPEQGYVLPKDFLPLIEEMGLQERLCQSMVSQALGAMRKWESKGFEIARVGVNFSGSELSNPSLCEWVGWELDRFQISPERLCIEVLENVVAETEDDVIITNLEALTGLGCRIDLDDFGTGHASIASIRRFSVDRIKIDRSFITRIDRDTEQQNMVSAILTMAERLGIDTLAEGVETIGEHAVLAQLGCAHVQGFSVARPMPLDQTFEWIAGYRQKMAEARKVGRIAG